MFHIVECLVCNNVLYYDTKNCLRYRWDKCKCNDRKHARGAAYLQEHIFEHFHSEGHNGYLLENSVTLLIKLIEKIILNKNTTGKIHARRWHLMVLISNMISKLGFV